MAKPEGGQILRPELPLHRADTLQNTSSASGFPSAPTRFGLAAGHDIGSPPARQPCCRRSLSGGPRWKRCGRDHGVGQGTRARRGTENVLSHLHPVALAALRHRDPRPRTNTRRVSSRRVVLPGPSVTAQHDCGGMAGGECRLVGHLRSGAAWQTRDCVIGHARTSARVDDESVPPQSGDDDAA